MTWQVGDLALCVRKYSECGEFLFGEPEPGRVYEVLDVDVVEFADGDHDIALTLKDAPSCTDEDDFPAGPVWWHGRFVKVTPPAADAFDRETIELMKGAPVDA